MSLRALRLVFASLLLTGCQPGEIDGPDDAADAQALSADTLRVSAASDRSASRPLEGAALAGAVYVFASGKVARWAQVAFFLDDPAMAKAPRSVDAAAPYDLAGTASDGSASPLATSTLAAGRHTLTVRVALVSGGQRAVTSTFSVGVAAAPDGGSASTPDAGAPVPDAGTPVPDAGTTVPSTCATSPWSSLELCGWPGPANTGFPAATALKSTAGRTITTDGTVIDGEKITGGLRIRARNVVVRNSWVTSSFAKGEAANGTGVINVEPGASATIERTRLDGLKATHACIWDEGTSLVARGNDCSGVNDGIFIWDTDNFTVEDNYLHDLTTETANGHIDGFQTEGASNGVIRHNTFRIPESQNAAVAIWNSRRNSDNHQVENNLIAGSGFAIYAEDYSPSEASPAGGFSVTNVRIVNNKFSTLFYKCVGYYGVWYPRGSPTDGWRRSGNVVIETGENLDNTNPHSGGQLCN